MWLDSISRNLLDSGTIAKYIEELSVTGLTSNPSIFEKAIASGNDYNAAIQAEQGKGLSVEELFFQVALKDINEAADLFRPVYDATNGIDGYVSLEVSPTLANDAESTINEGKRLFALANRPNLYIKVPGTVEGNVAIEELIFAGVNINVTLLFSPQHYVASAEAYLRGLERRQKAGLTLNVSSVASLFISRWDVPTAPDLPEHLANKLGIAIGEQTYEKYCELLASDRWKKLTEAGAHPQRLLWASTGTKDASLPDTYYVTAFLASQTVNTLPEKTLLAINTLTERGSLMNQRATAANEIIQQINNAGINTTKLAEQLQTEGANAFVKSWKNLMNVIEEKAKGLEG